MLINIGSNKFIRITYTLGNYNYYFYFLLSKINIHIFNYKKYNYYYYPSFYSIFNKSFNKHYFLFIIIKLKIN